MEEKYIYITLKGTLEEWFSENISEGFNGNVGNETSDYKDNIELFRGDETYLLL
jgi:hypothetical protein